MIYGLYDSKVELEEKVSATSGFRSQKVVDLGPIMLDAERCVHCSRCIRFEKEVTGTNLMEFRWRADHMEIATFEDRPITHAYAGNLAEACPVGALLSHDFRFEMRVWFLEATESVCPGCSTGCNVFIDHRDGEAYRLRGRRNAAVNRSWLCDAGRALYKEIALTTRVSGARLRRTSSWEDRPPGGDRAGLRRPRLQGRRCDRTGPAPGRRALAEGPALAMARAVVMRLGERRGGDDRPSLMGLAAEIPGLTALDHKRAASMADEGGVSAAAIEAQEWPGLWREIPRAWPR